jgi:hypothetical protein
LGIGSKNEWRIGIFKCAELGETFGLYNKKLDSREEIGRLWELG